MDESRIITLENGVQVTGATLLTAEEAERVPEDILSKDGAWWLSSPSVLTQWNTYVEYVDIDGIIDTVGYRAYARLGVRPALNINLLSSSLKVGDKFLIGEYTFDVISENKALCSNLIGNSVFRSDFSAADVNNYEVSDIKKDIDEWYNSLCIVPEGKSVDLGTFSVDVILQPNGKYDIWIAHEGSSGSHYKDISADKIGEYLAGEIESIAENYQ